MTTTTTLDLFGFDPNDHEDLMRAVRALTEDERALLHRVDLSEDGMLRAADLSAGERKLADRLAQRNLLHRDRFRFDGPRPEVVFERESLAVDALLTVEAEEEAEARRPAARQFLRVVRSF